MEERWWAVDGYEGKYEVSDLGRVRNAKTLEVKSTHLSSDGYAVVSLSGPKKNARVHHIVAAAFIGPRPKGFDCCHNDGDKANNAASNLRYATRLENIRDKAKHGTQTRGNRARCGKLAESDVREIRRRHSLGESCGEIAKDYPVDASNVNRIVRYRTWRHVDPEMNPGFKGRRLSVSDDVAAAIRSEYDGTVSQRALAERYGISESALWYIVNGITY